MFARLPIFVFAVAAVALAGCGSAPDPDSIVAATPTAITITSSRFVAPTKTAEAHCAKYNRKAVARGEGIKLGSPAYKVMWGFDCVDK